jgi:hypothetical protein
LQFYLECGGSGVPGESVRIALVSTPRSGNTWLKRILAQVLHLAELAVHRPEDLDWHTLPDRVIVQIHWLPDAEFTSLLKQHGFQRIVLARHPLDVLISILAFSQHDSTTVQWLDGAGGDERILEGACPTSDAFRTYATGPRAKALLSVSAAWWDKAEVCRVRYEDLLRDTAGQVSAILATLDLSICSPLEQAIALSTPEQMRAVSINHLYHVWHAQPAAWKQMLTASAALEICNSHQSVFGALGYTCSSDDSLQTAEARLAWDRNDSAALKRIVRGIKEVLVETEDRHARDVGQLRATLQRQQLQVQSLNAELQAVETLSRQLQHAFQQEVEQAHANVEVLRQNFASLPHERIRELALLGPRSSQFVRRLQRWSHHLSRARFNSLATLFRIR